jgi:hypothetical protein
MQAWSSAKADKGIPSEIILHLINSYVKDKILRERFQEPEGVEK